MNTSLMEGLLSEDESTALDFKRNQFPFAGASDDQKGELLKDILAFANAWRRTDAYILIGVEEVKGDRSKVVGVQNHLNDAELQQFVNSKTQRPVTFSYEAFPYQGMQTGIICIPLQSRPIYLKQDYGRLNKNAVYVRRGSSTAIAEPDEISRMGNVVLQEGLNLHQELSALVQELEYFLNESLHPIIERSITFPVHQYQRLHDKGIVTGLEDELRDTIREAYTEISNADRIIHAAWSLGRGSNAWAEGIKEGSNRLFDARPKVVRAINALKERIHKGT